MKITYLIFLFALVAMSCKTEPEPEIIMQPPAPIDTNTYTYLALGDSYTIGESVAEEDRWPNQLANKLKENGINISQPRIIALTGWTTGELQTAIKSANPPKTYDLVSLLIGVNNQYRGYEINEYIMQFEELLQDAIGFAQGDTNQVFVLSIPDYGATPFGQSGDPEKIGKEIDEYNKLAKEVCARYAVTYFNITEISREAENDPELVANDGLHPSGKMYTRWVQKIFSGVKVKVE